MEGKKIVFNNCGLCGLEELNGYEIVEVLTAIDASGDGFSIKAERKIDNVVIGRQFMREGDVYYLSNEYVKEVV